MNESQKIKQAKAVRKWRQKKSQKEYDNLRSKAVKKGKKAIKTLRNIIGTAILIVAALWWLLYLTVNQ